MTKHPIDSFCDALRAKRDAAEEHTDAQIAAMRAWMRDHLAPKTMTQSPESNALLYTFVSRVASRLQRGAATYGDTSFDKPLATTADEILQELEDVAGWAAIAWVRIKKQLAWVDESAKQLGLSEGPLPRYGVNISDIDPSTLTPLRQERAQDVAAEVQHDRRCHSNHGGSEDGS